MKKRKRRVRLGESLSLSVRKVLMASFLYYGLNESLISDAEYDRLCQRVADNWDKLNRHHQWQLGSPDDIRATGYHCKITHATVGGAISWLWVHYGRPHKPIRALTAWRRSKRYKVEWLHPEEFKYVEFNPKVQTDKPKKSKLKKRRVRL